jgi:hypothetical protein
MSLTHECFGGVGADDTLAGFLTEGVVQAEENGDSISFMVCIGLVAAGFGLTVCGLVLYLLSQLVKEKIDLRQARQPQAAAPLKTL